MFVEFLTKNDFREEYLSLFITRFTIGNLEMEDKYTDLTAPQRSIEMYTNMKAMQEILKNNPEKISPYDLMDIAYIVNNGCLSRGFRKTQVDVRKAINFFPISARQLPQAMYSLFDAYHNTWRDLDTFEREARFHIELVRLQPFEDGNKRTARIITSFNLLKANKAPIVIGDDQTEEYFNYIDNYDVEGMTELFRKSSNAEFDVMRTLYESKFEEEPIEMKDDSITEEYRIKKGSADIQFLKLIYDQKNR